LKLEKCLNKIVQKHFAQKFFVQKICAQIFFAQNKLFIFFVEKKILYKNKKIVQKMYA
jgi:phage antirepressor YoqD-like protein